MRQMFAFVVAVLAAAALSACEEARAKGAPDKVAQHLATFDDLDFNVYTHQKWDELGKSHAKDIIVHYPDGRPSQRSWGTSRSTRTASTASRSCRLDERHRAAQMARGVAPNAKAVPSPA